MKNFQPDLKSEIFGDFEIYRYSTVSSTNELAKIFAKNNAADRTVIIAEEQTGGRGRMRRNFFSPYGKGLWFSVILRPRFSFSEVAKCTFLAAVAIVKALKRFNFQLRIKWPNDIIFNGRKIAGILSEISSNEKNVMNSIIIGCGININIRREEFPSNIQAIATSLLEINNNKTLTRSEMFYAILQEFDELYNDVNINGFEHVIELWKNFNITLGKNVLVIPSVDNEKKITGKAIDISTDGALVMETFNGRQTIYAGEVSIRENALQN